MTELYTAPGGRMPVVPEAERVAALRRLGVSEATVRLSLGECLHEEFEYASLGPPYYVYNEARIPEGPPLIPLWDRSVSVYAVRERPDGPEFIEFGIEDEEPPTPLARTEQGFWAEQFEFLCSFDTAVEVLRDAASAVGFRYLDRLLAARQAAAAAGWLYADNHEEWLNALIAEVDREERRAA